MNEINIGTLSAHILRILIIIASRRYLKLNTLLYTLSTLKLVVLYFNIYGPQEKYTPVIPSSKLIDVFFAFLLIAVIMENHLEPIYLKRLYKQFLNV